MRLFWRHGYERTSLRALEAAMGMKRASIYAVFGDKEALFLKALAAYADEMRAGRLQALLQAPHPRKALEAHFRAMAIPMADGTVPGCLITNASVEMAGPEAAGGAPVAVTGDPLPGDPLPGEPLPGDPLPGDPLSGDRRPCGPVQAQLTSGLRMIEDVFARVIARGQAAGEISRARPARALARHLVNTAQGLRVLSRNPDLASWLDDILATAFAPLEPPPQLEPHRDPGGH